MATGETLARVMVTRTHKENDESDRSRPAAFGWNFSPHFGHSIRSKSTRLTRSGVIVNPHFGHFVSSDARTFPRLIFRDRAILLGSRLALNSLSVLNARAWRSRAGAVFLSS